MNFAPIDNKQLIETSSLIKLIASNDVIRINNSFLKLSN